MSKIKTMPTAFSLFTVSVTPWTKPLLTCLPLVFASGFTNAEALPAEKFDLSEWKITIPTDKDNNGKVDEISVKDIQSFEHKDFFYVDDEGNMVFAAPNKALTTQNSSNTRSELRHMLRGSNTRIKTHSPKNNFTVASNPISDRFAQVGGKLNATLKVQHVATRAKYPDKAPAFSVVVGQIHASKWKKKVKGFGWGNEPLKIYYKKWPQHETGSVFWTYERNLPKNDKNRTDIAYPVWGNLWTDPENPGSEGIKLNESFSYEVNVHGDVMYLSFKSDGHKTVNYAINLANGVNAYGELDQHDHPYGYTLDWIYFKAGAYNQCSTKDDDGFWYAACMGTGNWEEDKKNGDYVQVAFSNLTVGESSEPTETFKANLVTQRPAANSDNAKIGATLNKKETIPIHAIPTSALTAIKSIAPNFAIQEVEKEYKHDHVYLDVEGKDAKGNEIEFDMLQDGEHWKIVEVQRDMTMEDLPSAVKTLIKKQENSDQVRRIIESKQYGTDITIYEFYLVAENGTESRKEIKSENGEVVLLDEEWKH